MCRAFLISAQPGSPRAYRDKSCQSTCMGYRRWAGISFATGKEISAWSFKTVHCQSSLFLASIYVDDVSFIGCPALSGSCWPDKTASYFDFWLFFLSNRISTYKKDFHFLTGQLRETVTEPTEICSKDPESCTSKESFGHLTKMNG